jgi:hypothetical protein
LGAAVAAVMPMYTACRWVRLGAVGWDALLEHLRDGCCS